jgi:nitroreductase
MDRQNRLYENNPVLEAIRSRRSIRRYRAEQITEEELSLVVEAGRSAPTGGNTRTTRFVVVQSEEWLAKIQDAACREFAQMEANEHTYKSLRHSIEASKKGGYRFLYGAPTFIITTNLRDYGNAYSDCACALENMMLAAYSLGLGSCWINQLRWLADCESICALLEEMGVPREERVCGGLVVGYPAHTPPVPSQEGCPVLRL